MIIGYRYAIASEQSRVDCPGAGRVPTVWIDGLRHYWGLCPESNCRRQIGLTKSGGKGGRLRRHKVADFQRAS